MWNYFIPFAAGLLQGKDPIQAGTDAAISGTVGDVAGNFGSALDAGTAVNMGTVQNATNVPSLLTNSAGLPTSTSMMETLAGTGVSPASSGFSGPTSMMQNLGGQLPQNIPPQDLSYMQQYQATQDYSPYTRGSEDMADLGAYDVSNQMYPDYTTINKPGPQDVATAGGYEEVPLYKRAYDKVSNYIEDKPLEAALTGLTLGGALYEGFKPKQTQVAQAPLGPQLGGKQYSGGGDQLLKVRRPR